MNDRPRPAGALAALPTFFDADGAVDSAAIRGHVERLAAAGLDGVLACGSTGEFAALEEAERMAVAEAAVAGAAGRVAVAVQVGTPATAASVRLARHAAAAGADALACVTPYYHRADDAGLADHLRAIKAAAPELPLLAYSIPRLTGYAYGVELLGTLAAEGVVQGVKESSDEVGRLLGLREACGPQFAVLVGSPTLIAASPLHGLAGSITAFASVAPAEVARVHRLAADGDAEGAAAVLQRLLPAIRASALGMPPAGIKGCCTLLHGTPPALRAPRRALAGAELDQAREGLARGGLPG